MRSPLIRLRYFVWVVVPVSLWLGNELAGAPHMFWAGNTPRVSPALAEHPDVQAFLSDRKCVYLGIDGQFRHIATLNQGCPRWRYIRIPHRWNLPLTNRW